MPAARRLTLFGVGLQTRLLAAVAVLVIGCGGFLAYRAVAAIDDAYRYTGQAEAAALAHSFTRSLTARDVADVERIRARLPRLSGVHPDLTGVDVEAAGAQPPERATWRRHGDSGELRFPITDAGGRVTAVLRLGFTLDERAEALAAGRREVLLAGLGAGVLLVIGVAALGWLLLVRPVERLSRSALLVATGKPGEPLGWRRRDAIGVLAGSLDALGGTVRALQARIDGLVLQDPLTGVLN